MGVQSDHDEGLSLDSDNEESDDDDDDVEGEVAAALGGELGVGVAVGGSRVGSRGRATTMTVVVDGGLGVSLVEEVGIPVIPPFNTQQFTKGPYVDPQPVQMPQQLAFTPEENQQHGLVATRLATV
jgi:hypothetical protein